MVTMQFSVIMPVWPDEVRPYGLNYMDKVDWSRDDIEVILSHGLGPCRQRNEAAKIAVGDVLVLFDNDSCPKQDARLSILMIYLLQHVICG